MYIYIYIYMYTQIQVKVSSWRASGGALYCVVPQVGMCCYIILCYFTSCCIPVCTICVYIYIYIYILLYIVTHICIHTIYLVAGLILGLLPLLRLLLPSLARESTVEFYGSIVEPKKNSTVLCRILFRFNN